jgi:hypothetical protein
LDCIRREGFPASGALTLDSAARLIALMPNKYLLVDFENVPKLDLDAVPDGVTVPFFFGASQKKVDTSFLKSALRLGQRFIPIDIEGQGKNALDFYIAYYVGEYFALDKGVECVILSKDKGFDPLVKHLQKRGLKVRRVASVSEAFPRVGRTSVAVPAPSPAPAQKPQAAQKKMESATRPPPADADLARAAEILAKMPKKNRPRTRKRLHAHLKSTFAGKLADGAIQGLIDRLIARQSLRDDGRGSLTYLL